MLSGGKGVPPGSLEGGAVAGTGACADAGNDPVKCCAACQLYAAEHLHGGCDAWFMNGNDCFLKLCTASEWKDGACSTACSTASNRDNRGRFPD